MARDPPSRWSFGGPPTVTEIVIAALAVAMAVSGLSVAETVAWRWFIGGVVLVVVSLGPIKSYMVGTGASARFGEFYDAIGLAGRAVVILAVAAALVGAIRVSGVRGWSVFSFNMGAMLAVAGVVAIKWIRHREIA